MKQTLSRIFLCTLLLLAALSLWTGVRLIANHATSPRNLTALWRAELPDHTGQKQPLSQYRGQPLVVNFWASWCSPCINETPILTAAYKKYASKNIHFIGIAIDSADNVTQFIQNIQKGKVDYPLYIAGLKGTRLAYALGNIQGGLPFTVIIDASGRVRTTILGSVKMKVLQQQLDKL